MDFGTQGAQAPADLAWLRGVDAYTMGAYPQAEEEFRAAVGQDPGMADAWLGLHALRVDTASALLHMHRHRDRFGEQRCLLRRPDARATEPRVAVDEDVELVRPVDCSREPVQKRLVVDADGPARLAHPTAPSMSPAALRAQAISG